jgi:hypothetical protein
MMRRVNIFLQSIAYFIVKIFHGSLKITVVLLPITSISTPIICRQPKEMFHLLRKTHQNEAVEAFWHCVGLTTLFWQDSGYAYPLDTPRWRWVFYCIWQVVFHFFLSRYTGRHQPMFWLHSHRHSQYRLECYSNLGEQGWKGSNDEINFLPVFSNYQQFPNQILLNVHKMSNFKLYEPVVGGHY